MDLIVISLDSGSLGETADAQIPRRVLVLSLNSSTLTK
jgi:hypothetical protein